MKENRFPMHFAVDIEFAWNMDRMGRDEGAHLSAKMNCFQNKLDFLNLVKS